MSNRRGFLTASLAAMIALGAGCLAANEAEVDQAVSAGLPQPGPGLPAGTVVLPLPTFDHQPVTLRIPNQVGFLQAYQLGRGGESIVIINGGPGLDSTFVTRLHQGMAQRLPGRRVVRFDPRGMGGSSPTTAAQDTVAGAVDDVDAIRRFLGVRKLHLVGQSFGGFVAGAYAATHPDNVASIAFVDPLPPLPADDPHVRQGFDAINAYYQRLLDAGILPAGSADDPPGVSWNQIIGVYFADPLRVPLEITAPAEDYDPILGDALNTDYTDHGAPFVANLDRVRVPVVVIRGASSGFGPTFAEGALLAMRSSHPRLVTIPDAGHLPWIEKPAQVLGALQTFFDSCAHR
jgi:proline iminopeptidase